MDLSLNEIEGGLRKAAMGAGLPVGLAEETGRAAAALQGAGFDGVGAALACLRQAFHTPEPMIRDGLAEFGAGHAIAAGIAALDMLAAGGVTRATLTATPAPLMIAGLAMVAAEDQGHAYALGLGQGGFALVSPSGISPEGALPAGAGPVTVALTHPAAQEAHQTPTRHPVADALWAEVGALAARTYVPASAASRASGAGAGAIDND